MNLQEFFEYHGIKKKTVWASHHGIKPSVISKFLAGKQKLSLQTALKIITATNGAVSLGDLEPDFSLQKKPDVRNKNI